MAKNVSKKKPLAVNKRSHAMNATKSRQKLNLQKVRLEDGSVVRLSAREIRTLNKADRKTSKKDNTEAAA